MNRLRQVRKAMRLSARELSELSGISMLSIYRYETGERSPRISDLDKLANAMRVSVFDLIGPNERQHKKGR